MMEIKSTSSLINELKGSCPMMEWDAEDLICDLVNMGYFDMPASTRYHGAFAGGLAEHSMAVYRNLKQLTDKLGLKWQREESPWLVAVLHDLCKTDQYRERSDGSWEYRNDMLLTGHGEKSLMLCSMMNIRLTEEEAACIRYHMGAFCEKEQWNDYTRAVESWPNVLWTHTADMMASRFDGV